MDKEEKVLITIKEAMEMTGIGEKTLRRLLQNPRCPFLFAVGRRHLVKKDAFVRWINQRSGI